MTFDLGSHSSQRKRHLHFLLVSLLHLSAFLSIRLQHFTFPSSHHSFANLLYRYWRVGRNDEIFCLKEDGHIYDDSCDLKEHEIVILVFSSSREGKRSDRNPLSITLSFFPANVQPLSPLNTDDFLMVSRKWQIEGRTREMENLLLRGRGVCSVDLL